jgi:hypothetical protein
VLPWPQRRRQGKFAHSPLALQVFPRILKQHKFVIFYESNLFKNLWKSSGLPC